MGATDIVPGSITRERFDQLQPLGALIELPLTTDYTWCLTTANYEASLNLAKHDFDSWLKAKIPFVPVCHVSPVNQCEDDCGFRLYRELVDYAKVAAAENDVHLRFLTMLEVCSSS